MVEEDRGALRIGVVEQRAIDVDAEATRLRGLDSRDRAIEHAFLADRAVMRLAVAVEVDRPDEIGTRAVLMKLLLHQQRVGAQINELAPRDDAAHHLGQFLVQQRLAAGDRDHRGTARIDRLQALVDREALIEDLIGIIDLAAPGAREIAAEQRLEHEHQRIALAPGERLPHHIGADCDLLA